MYETAQLRKCSKTAQGQSDTIHLIDAPRHEKNRHSHLATVGMHVMHLFLVLLQLESNTCDLLPDFVCVVSCSV